MLSNYFIKNIDDDQNKNDLKEFLNKVKKSFEERKKFNNENCK